MNDVAYLKSHGHERTFIFLADSAQRNTDVWPTPSEYAVTFNAPFTKVTRFEIMEATVPRSDYLVDASENTLVYSLSTPSSIGTWAADVRPGERTATFEPGDYNLPQLVAHMNDVLAAVATEHGDPAALTVVATTTPAEVSNKVRIESSVPFCILGDRSTIRKTLGFGDPVDARSDAYAVVPGYTTNYPTGASGVFVAQAEALSDGTTQPALVGPLPPGSSTYEGVYGTRRVQEHFIAAAAGSPAQVLAYLAVVGSPPTGQWTVHVAIKRASDGAGIATGIMIATGSDYEPSAAEMTATAQLVAGAEYYVEFTPADAGTDADNCAALWYVESTLPPTGSFAAIDGVPVHAGSDFCVDVVTGAYGYCITSPGIVNLAGCKYIKIRCPNLEQYMDRDRVGEPSTAGLGMVSLIGYGFQNQRYNFVHYPPARFEPKTVREVIFRLERPDGSLYDSKGVDNNLLCAITFVDSIKPPPGTNSALHPAAPAYDANFLEMQRAKVMDDMKAQACVRKNARR